MFVVLFLEKGNLEPQDYEITCTSHLSRKWWTGFCAKQSMYGAHAFRSNNNSFSNKSLSRPTQDQPYFIILCHTAVALACLIHTLFYNFQNFVMCCLISKTVGKAQTPSSHCPPLSDPTITVELYLLHLVARVRVDFLVPHLIGHILLHSV